MAWFGRRPEPATAPTAPPRDTPESLRAGLEELVARIDRASGRLPVPAVVTARDVTDVVGELLESIADDPVPDLQVVLSVRGIVYDYLPTTLERYLALDPDTVHRPLPQGGTSATLVVEQLGALWEAASDVLHASRDRDADALITQGNFLRTKFTRSDLDL